MKKVKLLNNIIGCFYFKKTQNENLLGEFSHNKSHIILTESADIIKSIDNFVGEYHTTWQENTKIYFSKLQISHKAKSGGKIYKLIWLSDKGDIIFFGKGFLVDGILIGSYRDFAII